ncbi:MAG TPA: dTMP kinase [Candidatus Paceibacterota bacterium]
MRIVPLYTKVFVSNLLRYVFVPHNHKRGYFIVIDGGEGSGKSTIVERLKAEFPEIEFSREPGGTPYAEEIRKVMLNSQHAKDASGATILLLVSAGRSDHMDHRAAPAILSGKHFMTDRSDCTSWGYQIGGQEGGYALKKLFFAIRPVVYKKVQPDLYVILEVDPAEGARRVAERRGEINHFDERKQDFHMRVMQAYRTFGLLFPFRVKFVDANRTKDEVYADVRAILLKKLKK